jgi:D-alanyl-lipoteichoic acid acyltransferase DltB (MBOAT superfamily)
MLFNSYEFIFVFLPVVLGVFFVLGTVSRPWALRWIIVASLFFYAWWRPLNVLIIAPSIVVNFVLARSLQRLSSNEKRGLAKTVLLSGIVFNVAFLGYFKYANFAVHSVNDVFGTNMVLAEIILPLGISFITFQKIAFLIDVHAGRVESFTLQDYCLFVLFFPQLIAGPIVHYREMMPQFHRTSCTFERDNVSVGLTLFMFGLSKKVFLADTLGRLVTPIYEQAAAGTDVSLLPAWMAATGFTLQIYFDFSGYTDMALGIARCVGVRLPVNFNSPLRASSIIDFWLRWHVTLTRFLTAYVYNPLALALTRRRMAKGRPGLGGRQASVGAFLQLLMFPTLLTMFVSGVWHGAGYLFILWGVLHGVFLTVNHAWRLVGPKLWRDKVSYRRFMKPVGFALTFMSVAVSMVVFRSSTMEAVGSLFQGMVGLNGVALPEAIYDRLGPLALWLRRAGIVEGLEANIAFSRTAFWIVFLAMISFACPNTLQLLGRHEPALDWKADPGSRGAIGGTVEWKASLAWAMIVSVIAAIGMLHVAGQSEFLYWQF